MKKENLQKGIFNWVEEMSFAVVFVVLIFSFLFRIVAVNGSSMEPNYINGDRLVVSCINFGYNAGDVVVISEVLDDPIIKRIIATEGQKVEIDFDEGVVYINDVALDESIYGLENCITKETYTSLKKLEYPLIVPENSVFVLGDNRPVSNDSRYDHEISASGERGAGIIDVRNIIGKAVFRFLPFEKIGVVK